MLTPTAAFVSAVPKLSRRRHHAVSPRRLPTCQVSPPTDEYRHAEMLDDDEAQSQMPVWNSVIHASLKRKLQGLVAETPVASGVSGLLHAAQGYTVSTRDIDFDHPPGNLPPAQLVTYLLSAFQRDALVGAAAFVGMASQSCHVKQSSPQSLVLFIGDNDSYRALLRVHAFFCGAPRFEASGQKCVVSAEIRSSDDDTSKFDFQLSNHDGSWLIDEVFRL